VSVDHVAHLELPARQAAEAAAEDGHDLICFAGQILTGQYVRSLLDLSDVAEGLGGTHGGWTERASRAGRLGGRWYGVPDFFVALPVLWRKDLFDSAELGPPRTWDDLRRAARLLKARGAPTGMAFSHCHGANHGWRALMYSFGVEETDPSGEHVTLDSREMREALRFARALLDEGMTSEVFDWDDASDHRLLASGTACWIHGAISALLASRDTTPRVAADVVVLDAAAGPGGLAWSVGEPHVWAVWKFSKNAAAARDFIRHLVDRQPEAVTASRGSNMPFLRDHYRKPMPELGGDPTLAVLQDQERITAFFGHPGPITPAAQEVLSTFVIPDMFIRVARGEAIENTMTWGVGEMRRIYAKHGARPAVRRRPGPATP
jgi:multiple sugar transport system substrate-binding protein